MDLVKILKDCPKGTKLYSPLFGEVELIRVDDDTNTEYPIIVHAVDSNRDNSIESFTREGYFYKHYRNGKCVLFPSKDNRDWSTFKAPIEKFNILALKPFEQVIRRDYNNERWWCDLFSHYDISKAPYNFRCIASFYVQCIPYNEETKHLLGTTNMPPEKYINW